MFSAMFAEQGLLSSHWAVVVAVALAFFLLQTALALRFYLRLRRQERMLGELNDEVEQGFDGRGDFESVSAPFAWLRWIDTVFPPGSNRPRGNYSREEILQELDTRIASDSDYLLLQRLGVMAPLLGVVLTVVGFWWLQIDESEEQSLQSIMFAVTPLVSGVGAGAVLAMINQALLYWCGGRAESL
ncbi:MAG: hypothetical protein AAF961_12665, partial [Planctomycetota bacterium]